MYKYSYTCIMSPHLNISSTRHLGTTGAQNRSGSESELDKVFAENTIDKLESEGGAPW